MTILKFHVARTTYPTPVKANEGQQVRVIKAKALKLERITDGSENECPVAAAIQEVHREMYEAGHVNIHF